MRRSSLLALTVVGALICLMGGTGLFAALTDTARTGTNSVDSAALAASADIQIGVSFIPPTTPPNYGCGSLSEERATGFFTASNIGPGYSSGDALLCVKNVGSQAVTLSALATELADVDASCTGDEALFDDTCGGDKAGELSSVLRITYRNLGRCVDNAGGGSPTTQLLRDNAGTPAALGTIPVGQSNCYSVAITYPTTTDADAVQGAQTDRAAWRITFVGQS